MPPNHNESIPALLNTTPSVPPLFFRGIFFIRHNRIVFNISHKFNLDNKYFTCNKIENPYY
jgi:hypothetical protein